MPRAKKVAVVETDGVLIANEPKTETKIEVKQKPSVVLKNTKGVEVKPEDYFFIADGQELSIPTKFNESNGFPVDREDLVEVFDKIFKPEDNFLFLKCRDKEVYTVVFPLKFAKYVGRENDSIHGSCQIHAMSFIAEGSANIDTLKSKLKRISTHIKNDR